MNDIHVEIEGNIYALDALIRETLAGYQTQQASVPAMANSVMSQLPTAERERTAEVAQQLTTLPSDQLPDALRITCEVMNHHLSLSMEAGRALRDRGSSHTFQVVTDKLLEESNLALIDNTFAEHIAQDVFAQLQDTLEARRNVQEASQLLNALISGVLPPISAEQLQLASDPLAAIDQRINNLFSPESHDNQPPIPAQPPEPIQDAAERPGP